MFRVERNASRVPSGLQRGELELKPSAIHGHQPDGLLSPILFPIDDRHNVGRLLTIRRNPRIADELKREVILRSNSAIRERRGGENENQAKQTLRNLPAQPILEPIRNLVGIDR